MFPLNSEDASENLAPEPKPKDSYDIKTSAKSEPIIAPNICVDSYPLITPTIEQPMKITESNNYESPQIDKPKIPSPGDVIELSTNFLPEKKPQEQSSTKPDNLQINTTDFKMTP